MLKNRAIPIHSLLLLYAFIIIGGIITNILPPIQTLIIKEWHEITVGMLGYISGVITFVTTGLAIYFGYLGDKYKRKNLAIFGSIVTSVFTILAAFAESYYQFFVYLVISSIGFGSVMPAIYAIFSDAYKAEERSKAFAKLSIITGVAGGALAVIFFIEIAMINWRYPYLIMGISSCIFTPFLFLVKEPPRGAKEAELEELYEKDPSVGFQYKIKKEDINVLWKRKTNLFLILNFVDNIPGGIILTYGVSWLVQDHGMRQDQAFIFLAIFGIGSLIGTVFFAWFGDKRSKKDELIKLKLGIWLSIGSVPFILIAVNLKWKVNPNDSVFALLTNPLLVLTMILAAVGMAIDSGIYPNWLSSITEINLPEHRSTMISLANFFDAVGRALGIFIGGYLIDTIGYSPALSVAVMFTILSFVWWLPALKYYRKDLHGVKQILAERGKIVNK